MPERVRTGRFTVNDEWYRWMVQSIDGYAVFSTDLQNRIITWDEGAERVFGYGRDDVLGEDVRFIFTPEDIKHHVPETELADAITRAKKWACVVVQEQAAGESRLAKAPFSKTPKRG